MKTYKTKKQNTTKARKARKSTKTRNTRKSTKTRKTRKANHEKAILTFWRSLAEGKYIIVIPKKGKYYKLMNATSNTFKELESNPEIKAVLTSAMSYELYERLSKQAKKNSHTVDDIIKYYKKYFLHYDTNPIIWYLK